MSQEQEVVNANEIEQAAAHAADSQVTSDGVEVAETDANDSQDESEQENA